MIIWLISLSWREVKVFNTQAWDSHLKHESEFWQVYKLTNKMVYSVQVCNIYTLQIHLESYPRSEAC